MLIPIGIGIIFVGVLSLGVLSYIRVNAAYRRNIGSPIQTQRAKLVQKRIEGKRQKHMQEPEQSSNARVRYILCFQLENGDTKEFTVSEANYYQYDELELGRLTTQGSWFKAFQPDHVIGKSKEWAEH